MYGLYIHTAAIYTTPKHDTASSACILGYRGTGAPPPSLPAFLQTITDEVGGRHNALTRIYVETRGPDFNLRGKKFAGFRISI